MPFDYTKEYKEFYLPPRKPQVIEVPLMNFLAVRGAGDPNEEGGAYSEAMGLLYTMAWTLKMSDKGGRNIEGFFAYKVPPLEGFWWQEGVQGVNLANKRDFQWISVIRLPDFVKREDFDWAREEATRKKKMDFSAVEFFPCAEGLCVQCMHIGPYDEELVTIALMDAYARENGYALDFGPDRRHHEIYLGDPRRTAPEKRRTVLRHPVRVEE